ncbi:hypothetical protein [Streptomyces sp. NPDC054783]
MGEEDTSIKTTRDVRDRLRVLASERGTTMNDLLVARELTEEEREQRAQQALEEIRQTTGVTVF